MHTIYVPIACSSHICKLLVASGDILYPPGSGTSLLESMYLAGRKAMPTLLLLLSLDPGLPLSSGV